MLLQLSQFSLLSPSAKYVPSLQQSPLSSCPWVLHISSLSSPFSILYLTSSCLFCTYQLCFLILVPFPLFSPFPVPADNPPNDLCICNSVPIVVVCLISICFCFLDSAVDVCEFVVILMFIVLIFFFFNKFL